MKRESEAFLLKYWAVSPIFLIQAWIIWSAEPMLRSRIQKINYYSMFHLTEGLWTFITVHCARECAARTDIREQASAAAEQKFGRQKPIFICGKNPAFPELTVRERFSFPAAVWNAVSARIIRFPLRISAGKFLRNGSRKSFWSFGKMARTTSIW